MQTKPPPTRTIPPAIMAKIVKNGFLSDSFSRCFEAQLPRSIVIEPIPTGQTYSSPSGGEFTIHIGEGKITAPHRAAVTYAYDKLKKCVDTLPLREIESKAKEFQERRPGTITAALQGKNGLPPGPASLVSKFGGRKTRKGKKRTRKMSRRRR